MSVKYSTKLVLAFRSGNRCAFPGCQRQLTADEGQSSDPSVIGQAAHIAGERPTAARYDPSMTDEQRNHYNNLIYLCRDHHGVIDTQKEDFPVTKLLQMKKDHESRVYQAVKDGLAKVGFEELAYATERIVQQMPSPVSDDFTVTPPDEKIRKNKLSERSRLTIIMGLGVAKDVRLFIEAEAKFDPDFPERLKAGFLEKYYQFRREGFNGDELFDLMCSFAQRGLDSQVKRSAGLAILVYLFEACEVFEK